MSAVVIDTNVLLIADGKAAQMSAHCQIECMDRLDHVKVSEQVALDESWLILEEYSNKLAPNQSQTFGSAFLKWLLQVQGDPDHTTWVKITPTNNECTQFREFPNDPGLKADFDPADRKFVAVANAHPEKPPIIEAGDSKWLAWRDRLSKHGIQLDLLCHAELQAIHKKKQKKKRKS